MRAAANDSPTAKTATTAAPYHRLVIRLRWAKYFKKILAFESPLVHDRPVPNETNHDVF